MVVDLSQFRNNGTPHPDEGPVTSAFRKQMGADGQASPQVESFAARNPAAMQELMFLAQRVSMGPEQKKPDIPVLNAFVAGFFTGVLFRESRAFEMAQRIKAAENDRVTLEAVEGEHPSPMACPNCDETGFLAADHSSFSCPHCTYTEDRA